MTRPSRPPVRDPENEAALYDGVFVPRVGKRLATWLASRVAEGSRLRALDPCCRTGAVCQALLERLDPASRLVAVDADAAFLELARRRALVHEGRRIFFKVEQPDALGFDDAVFDLVAVHWPPAPTSATTRLLSEAHRVLVSGGRLLLVCALAGSFEEPLDALREVALRFDRPELAARADALAARYPGAAGLTGAVRAAGFEDVSLEIDDIVLPFRHARALVSDPLARWLGVRDCEQACGAGPEGERLFGDVERTLDVYHGGGPLSLRMHAGLVSARRAED
ncbi:MAG: class I SAM-dependent methyltransferase [Myxococcota bacterium]|nr:class I SAM-dependent methyltransferase [Myxococcota bacterium]